MSLEAMVKEVWDSRELLKNETYAAAVRSVIEEVDKGKLRTAEPVDTDKGNVWKVNEWVKQAILIYFGIQQMETYYVASI